MGLYKDNGNKMESTIVYWGYVEDCKYFYQEVG